MSKHIALDKCVHGHVYRLEARNFSVGVFDKPRGEFIGPRYKFDDLFLYPEQHWDTGAPHGTVKPYEDLGPLPAEIGPVDTGNDDLLTYLMAQVETDNGIN